MVGSRLNAPLAGTFLYANRPAGDSYILFHLRLFLIEKVGRGHRLGVSAAQMGNDYPPVDDFCHRLRGHPGIAILPFPPPAYRHKRMGQIVLDFPERRAFFAGYWFVTMSVFSGAVLVSLRRYRHHIGLGVILLAFLVAYNVNLYLEWFTSNHSKAFMGYVFYIWLGVQFAFHLKKVLSWINSIPKIIVFILVVISTALSGLEGAYLKSIGSEDPFGSIRITNGIASMLLLVLFLRTIEGRRTRIVFGMYLIHIIVLVLLTPLSVMIISKFRLYQTVASMVTVQVTWFALIMVITYYLTKWMGKSSWRWVIGGIKPASASRT